MSDSPRIVLVDEDWGIRMLLSRFFRQHGFQVTAAEDGIEGLRLIKALMPDAVILDIRLPGMDGITVSKMVRSYRPTKSTPIVLLTKGDKSRVEARTADLNIHYVMAKPFRVSQLLSVIQRVIQPREPGQD